MNVMIKCKMGNCEKVTEKDICCVSCDMREGCDISCESNPSTCGDSITEETGLQMFKEVNMTILKKVVEIVNQKKALEAQEDELKAKIKDAMEKGNIKKFESEILNITYIAETSSTSVDSKKLKDQHPAIYEECSKVSKKSAYIKISVK